MNKKFLYLLFTLLNSTFLLAKINTIRYLNSGLGAGYIKLIDQGMSPLMYRGTSVNFDVGLEKRKTANIQYLNLSFSAGITTPSISKQLTHSVLYPGNFEINYRYVWKINRYDSTSFHYYIGTLWSNHGNIRYHNVYDNNAVDFDIISSVNLACCVQKKISIKGKKVIELFYTLETPVLNALITPSYNCILPEPFLTDPNPGFKTGIRSFKIGSVGRYQQINSMFDVLYYLKNGNAIKVSYHWNYSNISAPVKITNAAHSIIFSTLFNF